jgi:hypothetical protein
VKKRVHALAEQLAAEISQWDGVEAILLGEAADIEIYDPYFTVDLDVYIQGEIPPAAERRDLLADVEGYESSSVTNTDRFVVNDLPVTAHFMQTEGVDANMRRIIDSSWVFHEAGTNAFYRIEKGEVLYSRGGWLASIRAARAEIPDTFWEHVCLLSYTAAERALSDLGAAAFRSDDLLFIVAAARFLRSVASYLFASNRQFEPSGRMLSGHIKSLPRLPDGFLGRLESFLRPADGLSALARREIAELIIGSLLPLGDFSPGHPGLGRAKADHSAGGQAQAGRADGERARRREAAGGSGASGSSHTPRETLR